MTVETQIPRIIKFKFMTEILQMYSKQFFGFIEPYIMYCLTCSIYSLLVELVMLYLLHKEYNKHLITQHRRDPWVQ